jgi:hypothetical protein
VLPMIVVPLVPATSQQRSSLNQPPFHITRRSYAPQVRGGLLFAKDMIHANILSGVRRKRSDSGSR